MSYIDAANQKEARRLHQAMSELKPSLLSRLMSDKQIKDQLQAEMNQRLDQIGFDQDKIARRLVELDREWDLDRALKVHAGILAASGITLGLTMNKRWFALPLLMAGVLFQNSTTGWSLAVPGLRRLGYRTQDEIGFERAILIARQVGGEKNVGDLHPPRISPDLPKADELRH